MGKRNVLVHVTGIPRVTIVRYGEISQRGVSIVFR